MREVNNENEWVCCRLCPNYDINKNGLVRNRKTGNVLKTRKDKKGNIRISLIDRGGYLRWFMVSELVTDAFVEEKPGDDYMIKYKDGDPDNIYPENLEWIPKPLSSLSKVSLYRDVIIRCIETDNEYYNIYAASDELGIPSDDIANNLLYGDPCERKNGRYVDLFNFEVVRIEH